MGRVTVNRTYLLWEFVRNRDEVVSDSSDAEEE